MKKVLLACFFPFYFFGTVNEPLRCGVFSGYRSDRQHWHLQDPGSGGALTYSELARGLQFWENGISLQGIRRDIVFYLKGSYAAFGRGPVFQRYANLGFTNEQPHFQFSSQGFAADTSGYLGFAVNLTADRLYKVIFIPLLGFSAHFEQLRRQHGTPSLFDGGGFTMQSSLPQKLYQTWYGVFLGGGFQIEPMARLVLQTSYSYHWLHCRFKTNVENRVNAIETRTKVSVSAGGNMGHTGWAELDYLWTQLCRFGIGAQIHYFSSRVVDASLDQNDEYSSEKFKLRWTSISGYLQVSRAF